MSIIQVDTIQKRNGTQFPLIGQVVSTTQSGTVSISSSSTSTFVDITGLSVNITPTSTSSKILFLCCSCWS